MGRLPTKGSCSHSQSTAMFVSLAALGIEVLSAYLVRWLQLELFKYLLRLRFARSHFEIARNTTDTQ